MNGLSEILLAEGIVTPAQLEEALEAQAVYGGNLDTCLLELGFCSERELEPLLSRAFGLSKSGKTAAWPPQGKDWQGSLPTDVLALVTPTEAMRFRVLPFKQDDKHLDLLTPGPVSTEVQTELGRRSGRTLRLHVVTEPRFALLLEQHYGIACPPRFRSLLADDTVETPLVASGAAQGAIVEEKIRQVRDPAEEAAMEFQTAEAPSTAMRSLDESLRRVATRDDIPAAIFPFLLSRAHRAALFVARPTLVLGWDAAGPGVDTVRMQTLCFPLRHPSMFQEAGQGDLFVGPVPYTPVNEEVIRRLGEPRMTRSVVAPIRIRGRLCVFLLADFASDRSLEQGFSLVGEVAERVSRTLLRLAMDRKRETAKR